MRVKTKIGIFIALVFIVLGIGLFAGKQFVAIGGTTLGVIVAAVAYLSGNRKPSGNSITDADKRARDVERENRAAIGSMDRVSSGGENLRAEGERLVNQGDKLVGESQGLIDELRKRDAGANKGA